MLCEGWRYESRLLELANNISSTKVGISNRLHVRLETIYNDMLDAVEPVSLNVHTSSLAKRKVTWESAVLSML